MKKVFSALLAICIMLTLLSITASATPNTFSTDDIAIINGIINANGLDWGEADANGSSVPDAWETKVFWNTSTPKRVIKLKINFADLTTGSLDVTGLETLEELQCGFNQLTTLKVNNLANLWKLYCNGNKLTELDFTGLTGLKKFECNANQFNTLDLSPLTNLEYFDCRANQLTSLNLNSLTKLQTLYCNNNKLPGLQLSVIANYAIVNVSENYMPNVGAVVGNAFQLDTGNYTFSPQKESYSVNITNGVTNMTRAAENDTVILTANEAPLGQKFKNWNLSEEVENFLENTDINSKVVKFSMPQADVTATATYEPVIYTITVNGGTANPTEATMNTNVAITASQPEPGMYFTNWTVDTGNAELGDSDAENTSFIMPAGNVTVTANFEDYPTIFHTGDIAVINNIITANSLDWGLAPANGSSTPATWIQKVYWNNDDPQRVEGLRFENLGLSGTLDLRGLEKIEAIYCQGNSLTGLNVSGLEHLMLLECYSNKLPSLNVLGLDNLQYLDCGFNPLGSLNVSNLNRLEYLSCYNNHLETLDVSTLSALKELGCNYNFLTTLDVRGLNNLEYLNCEDNKLSTLYVSNLNKLRTLYCNYNYLTELDVTGTALKYLWVQYNLMESKNKVTGKVINWDGDDFRFSPQYDQYHEVTFTAEPIGPEDHSTATTGIRITFSQEIDDFTRNDFDIFDIMDPMANIPEGDFTGEGTTWELAITDVEKERIIILIIDSFRNIRVMTDPQLITIHKGAAAASYTINYDPTDGQGAMENDTAYENQPFVLPANEFNPPANKQFKTWAIGTAQGPTVNPGGKHTFTEDTTVYAVWEEIPAAEYDINVVRGTANPAQAAMGTIVILTANAAQENQQFKEWDITPAVEFTQGTDKYSNIAKFTMPNQPVNATAIYLNIGGDGGGDMGGGEDYDDDDYNPPAPPPAPTVPVNDGDVNIPYDESNGTVSLGLSDGITEEIMNKSVDNKVEFDVSGVQGALSAELPKNALEAFGAAGLDVSLKLPSGNITFDQEAINSVVGQTDGDKVTVELSSVEPETLTDSQKQAVSEDDLIVDINIFADEKKISTFSGELEIQIPYTGPLPVTVWYLNDAGELEELECEFENGVVTFRLNHLSLYVLGHGLDEGKPWANPFTDIKETDWFYNAVKFAYKNKLMAGISNELFNPRGTTTRGMIVTILHRLEGMPEATVANPFTDVTTDKYYGNAVIWAAENKIISGYSSDKFGPDDCITREQLAAILMNYANYKGYDTDARTELDKFVDVGRISQWAKNAMSWANANTLMVGDGRNLNPTEKGERGQAAAILQRFLTSVAIAK